MFWSSKKQSIVALLSTEVKYVAQTHAAKEAVWLRAFYNKINGKQNRPLTILSDNQSAIALSKGNKFHLRTKHIDLRYHFIREAVEDEKVRMKHLPSGDNVADIFTKTLAKVKFTHFVSMLGLEEMKN